jgi:DNA invertase Pin-like site-specific DNA recombinase
MPVERPERHKGEAEAGRLTAGYVRVSVVAFPEGCTDAAGRNTWLAGLQTRRRSELAADAARSGDRIDVWYDDLGVSGRGEHRERRAGFGQLCRDARRGRLRRVYARDVSRLFRDLTGQEAWFAEMEAWGVEVRAGDLPAASDPASARLFRQQMGAIHEYMAERASALTAAARREMVRQGRWVGTTRSRWGLRYDAAAKAFRPDPATADRARLVFEVFVASGGLTAAAWSLNRMLDDGQPRATPTPSGGRWADWQVREFVRHPAYRRTVVYGDLSLPAPHLIPEVVPPDLVAEAGLLLGQPARARSAARARLQATAAEGEWLPSWRPLDSTYLGLLYCGYCGGPLSSGTTPQGPDAGRRTPWKCQAANRGDGGGAYACPCVFRVTSARLDALVGRGVHDSLRAYGQAAGWDAPPPGCPGLTRSVRPDEMNHLLPLGTATEWPTGPRPLGGAGRVRPDQKAWRRLSARAGALWPDASPLRHDERDTLWLRPAWEPDKRALVHELGLTVGVRVLYPPRPATRLGRDLRQCGGQCWLSLQGPPEGVVGPEGRAVVESYRALLAYRSWVAARVRRGGGTADAG